MKFKNENGTLTLFLEGKIDSANASQTEKELFEILNENPHDRVALDFSDLKYISSAGLRVVLRIRKTEAALKITNVNSEIYEVLDMTGFTEMITVEKAYRRFSVDNCEKIAEGANGIVYRLDADTIIKVYKLPDCLPDIQRERELARKAFILGIPTAIPYDVVKVGDSYGSVFELLNAKSFAKLIAENPRDTDKYVALFVDLLKKIHSTKVKEGEMPRMKTAVCEWVDFLKNYLPQKTWQKLRDLTEAVPETDTMIHGDYHLRNVMMQNGEVLLIDMDTLSVGHPIFEFGSIFNAFVGFGKLDHAVTENFMGLPYETTVHIWEKLLQLYFENDEQKIKKAEIGAEILGYTRLMRRTIRRWSDSEAEKAQLAFYKKNIVDLVEITDSLADFF